MSGHKTRFPRPTSRTFVSKYLKHFLQEIYRHSTPDHIPDQLLQINYVPDC